MRKLLGVVGVLSLLASAPWSGARAADLLLKAPPPVPVWSWSGFYLGLNVGGSWGRASDTISFIPPGGAPALIANERTSPDGIIGGGQVGYNWQRGHVVFGIESDIQGSGQQDSATVTGVTATCGVPCSVTESDRLTWFGTTRGRLGYAWVNWMAYVTGGAAYGGIRTSGTENFVGGVVPTLALTSSTQTRGGWTVGGGLEGHLRGRWTWKVEYLHMDFGTTNFAFAEPAPLAPGLVTQSLRVTDNVLRAGVDWHFNGPIAAVAPLWTK